MALTTFAILCNHFHFVFFPNLLTSSPYLYAFSNNLANLWQLLIYFCILWIHLFMWGEPLCTCSSVSSLIYSSSSSQGLVAAHIVFPSFGGCFWHRVVCKLYRSGASAASWGRGQTLSYQGPRQYCFIKIDLCPAGMFPFYPEFLKCSAINKILHLFVEWLVVAVPTIKLEVSLLYLAIALDNSNRW